MLLCRLQNRQINENGGRMTDKLSFMEFERCVERGKAIDGEQLFNLVYELHEENIKLKGYVENLVNADAHWEEKARQRVTELETENQQLYEKNIRIIQEITETYNKERTQIGQNVLKQLLERI